MEKIMFMEFEGKSEDPRTLSPLEIDFLLVPHTFHAISNKCFVTISGRYLVGNVARSRDQKADTL
jgi:hypothetical protein